MADQIDEHQGPIQSTPVTAPITQDDEAQADVKMVLKLFDIGKLERKKYDVHWNEYEDFYHGKQWDAKGRGGTTKTKGRARPVLNISRVTIQSILPILTDARPGFNVLPGGPEDFPFAKSLGKVTQSWWQKFEVGMDHTLVEVLMDSQIFDAGILKVVWDAEMEEGAGDIKCDVVNPRDIFVPPEARDFHKNCPWVIHRLHKPVGELKLMHPKYADIIKPDDGKQKDREDLGHDTEVTLVSPIDRNYGDIGGQAVSGKDDRKLATVLECWMDDNSLEEYVAEEEFDTGEKGKDGKTVMATREIKKLKKKYPRGKLISILPHQKVRLVGEENPFKHGKKPFVRFIDALLPRKFWGEGEVGPLMDIQKILNKILANILDYMNLMSNPIWINEADSGVDNDTITNAYGLILTPDVGKAGAIRREIAPPLNKALFEFYRTMLDASEMISGANDITQGRKPSGVTAGAAIESLQEAAQTRIRLKERNMQVSISQLGYLVIQLMMQFYNEPRVARISGKKDWPEMFEFFIQDTPDGFVMNKQDFDFDKDNERFIKKGPYQPSEPTKGIFDVEVLSGTAMPFAKTQRVNTAFKLEEREALDKEGLLDAVEWPDKDQVLQRINEANQAAAAAEAAQAGAPPPPVPIPA